MHEHGNVAALTLAVAMAAGVVAQALGRHLNVPGIVLLLATGVLLGPEFAGIVEPTSLGGALAALVGFAVAVILFEGGMSLDVRRIVGRQGPIRLLVTVGALITTLGGTLCARYLLGWPWRTSVLFGTLIIVTGPTVITPLLRRIRVKTSVATVLEAEGIFGDAIGATVAVVALEVAIGSAASGIEGLASLTTRLSLGALWGLIGGLCMAWLLRARRLVPPGLENVLTFTLVMALYQAANWVVPESGIPAAIVAGIVVGHLQSPATRRLLEFKEQLSVMAIGTLFVLLAANVSLRSIQNLGTAGVMTVALLVLVVRPLAVLASTWGSSLSWRARVFIAWMGPRGIVAAAVASLFATQLSAYGLDGGQALESMVFLVIAITVTLAGLTGGLVARLLRLLQPTDCGWVILGANPLARSLGRALQDAGHDVVCVDTNAHEAELAEAEGLRVVVGNALLEDTLLETNPEIRAGFIALTTNTEVNVFFAEHARERARRARILVALDTPTTELAERKVAELGATVLFGRRHSAARWNAVFEQGTAAVERWRYEPRGGSVPPPSGKRLPTVHAAGDPTTRPDEPGQCNVADTECPPLHQPCGKLLPLLQLRGRTALPVDDHVRFRRGDEAVVVLNEAEPDAGRGCLRRRGWVPVTEPLAQAAQGVNCPPRPA